MADVPVPSNRELFTGWVHDALTHLYDTHFLGRHPLADLLVGPIPGEPQRSQALRRILIDTIRSLRPAGGVPAQSPDWRSHHILELRYIEGLTPAQTMERLALSKSHYFREQARVVDVVADVLWAKALALGLDTAAHVQPTLTQPGADKEEAASGSRSELAQAEVERLCAHATWEELDVVELLAALRPMIESLASANGVTLQMGASVPCRITQGNRTLLRQSILNVVTYALDMAQGGILTVEPVALGGEGGYAFRAQPLGLVGPPESRRQGIGLEIGRRLVAAMQGRLIWEYTSAAWEAKLLWPQTASSLLLVVDDNRSFIELVRRYLVGAAWQVLGAQSAAGARKHLAEHPIRVVILDVMMPEEDGWDLLRALRADETARDRWIIVCSVLNEPKLAQMMGADAYLPKPVSPQALLQALPAQDASRASTR